MRPAAQLPVPAVCPQRRGETLSSVAVIAAIAVPVVGALVVALVFVVLIAAPFAGSNLVGHPVRLSDNIIVVDVLMAILVLDRGRLRRWLLVRGGVAITTTASTTVLGKRGKRATAEQQAGNGQCSDPEHSCASSTSSHSSRDSSFLRRR